MVNFRRVMFMGGSGWQRLASILGILPRMHGRNGVHRSGRYAGSERDAEVFHGIRPFSSLTYNRYYIGYESLSTYESTFTGYSRISPVFHG